METDERCVEEKCKDAQNFSHQLTIASLLSSSLSSARGRRIRGRYVSFNGLMVRPREFLTFYIFFLCQEATLRKGGEGSNGRFFNGREMLDWRFFESEETNNRHPNISFFTSRARQRKERRREQPHLFFVFFLTARLFFSSFLSFSSQPQQSSFSFY